MRFLLIIFVALANLALGFVCAVKAGRGPWSSHARRCALDLASNPDLPADPSDPGDVPVGNTGATARSIGQLAEELSQLETSACEVQQRLAGNGAADAVQDLRSLVRRGVSWIEGLDLANESLEYPEEATASLCALLMVLQAVEVDVDTRSGGKAIDQPALEVVAARVLEAFQESGVVMNGLGLAEMPN